MKNKVINTTDFAHTTTSGFNFTKSRPVPDAEHLTQNLIKNYNPCPSRNITYFRDILNYSRNTLTSIYPNTPKIKDGPSKRLHTDTCVEFMSYRSKNNNNDKSNDTLITQKKKAVVHKQSPSLYELDTYYNQFESAIQKDLLYKKPECDNITHSLTPTHTISIAESNSNVNKLRAKKLPARAFLSERKEKTSTNFTNRCNTILIDTESNIQSYIDVNKKNKRTNSHTIANMKRTVPLKQPEHTISSKTFLSSKICKTNKNNNYKLPESLLSIRSRLRNQTDLLAEKSNKCNVIENIREVFEKTKDSLYTIDIIDKIKLVNNFISNQSEDKFKSDKLRHRKIFVIVDGQVIFSEKKIQGIFVEIPTCRYLNFLESKKERLEKYYEFLATCQEKFHSGIPFKNIFLLSGINVFDLGEIPPQDKAVYISMSNIFRGVHLFNERKTYITAADYSLLRLKEGKVNETQMKGKRQSKCIFMIKKKKKVKLAPPKEFKTIKKIKKYLNEQSFTFGLDDVGLEQEEYVYYSDIEKKSNDKAKTIQEKYPTLIDQILYFNEIEKEKKIKEIKKKCIEKLKKKLSSRPDEESRGGLEHLLNKYNVDRGKKYNINMAHQMKPVEKETQESLLTSNTTGIGLQLLKKLRIFKDLKKDDIVIDEKEFYKKEMIIPIETIIKRNIRVTYDVTPLADTDIQQYLPDLVSLNIPRVLDAYPKLKRKELYEIFVQFKTLLMFCVCINRDLKVMKRGIDFDTLFNCNSQIKSQGGDIAQKIFKTINNLDSKYLNWDQYMKGMHMIKSKDISDKIGLFFKVIDTDGNGMLSYDEVFDLSVKSLHRSIGIYEKEDEVVQELATYFANLIFQLVDLPIDEEIPLDLIKEKIIEGRSAAGYLEMFICADNFIE